MEIYERIKIFRKKELKITQEEFAKKIKMSRSNWTNIEIGGVLLTDRVISDICREFDVNENWLRTGEGDPYIKLEGNDLIIKATRLLGEKDPVFESFIEIYSQLDSADRATIKKIGLDLLNKVKEKEKKE